MYESANLDIDAETTKSLRPHRFKFTVLLVPFDIEILVPRKIALSFGTHDWDEIHQTVRARALQYVIRWKSVGAADPRLFPVVEKYLGKFIQERIYDKFRQFQMTAGGAIAWDVPETLQEVVKQ